MRHTHHDESTTVITHHTVQPPRLLKRLEGPVEHRKMKDKVSASGDLQSDTSGVAMNGASAPSVTDNSTTLQPTTPPASTPTTTTPSQASDAGSVKRPD